MLVNTTDFITSITHTFILLVSDLHSPFKINLVVSPQEYAT